MNSWEAEAAGRTAVKADPVIQVCAVPQDELIHLRELIDCGSPISTSFPDYRTLHHVTDAMAGKVVA